MVTIATDRPVVTLVNVFDVDPENQQPLIEVLVAATEQVMRQVPGFVSANIHRSLDGTRVVNYAQWRSVEDFEAMTRRPDVLPHATRATELANAIEPRLYEVVFSDEAR
jgi:heme-degrading monooxygenase HmoA